MMKDLILTLIIAITIQFTLAKIFELGVAYGQLSSTGRLNAITARTIKEGNILKYSFRNKRRQEQETSDCDSASQSEDKTPNEKET